MANNVTRWTKQDPPNILLAIDPGYAYPGSKGATPYCGAALFQWGMLAWGALVKCPTVIDKVPVAPFSRPNALVKKVCEAAHIARTTAHAGETLTVLTVEQPLLYVRGAARPKDIVDLRGIYGAFMGGIDAEFYSGPYPAEWKGTIDKKILHERALVVLNSSERMLLVKSQRAGDGGMSEHVLDATALGLFAIGRIGKAGVV